MGPYIGLLLLLAASVAWGASVAPVIETDNDSPDLDPEHVETILNLVQKRIELETAQTVEASEGVQKELDANLENLNAELKGREDDLKLILHLIKFEMEREEPSVDDVDEYRFGRKKKRKPCRPCGKYGKKRKKPKIGRIIGRIFG